MMASSSELKRFFVLPLDGSPTFISMAKNKRELQARIGKDYIIQLLKPGQTVKTGGTIKDFHIVL